MHSLTCSRMSEELRGGQEGIFPGCERRCTTGGSGREGVVPLSKPPHLDGAAQLGSPLQRGREELGGQEGSRSGPFLPAQRSLAEAFPAQRATPCWGLGLTPRPAPRGVPSACWGAGRGAGKWLSAVLPQAGTRAGSRAGLGAELNRPVCGELGMSCCRPLPPSPAAPRTGQAATASQRSGTGRARGEKGRRGPPGEKLPGCSTAARGDRKPGGSRRREERCLRPARGDGQDGAPALPGRSPALGREGAEPSGPCVGLRGGRKSGDKGALCSRSEWQPRV